MNLLKREPAVSAAVVSDIVALASALGFHLSATVVGIVVAAVTAVLGVVVRSQVTPVKPQREGEHAAHP